MGDHVIGVDDLDVVGGLNIGGADNALAVLTELQHDFVATVELENDTLQIQKDINDIFLHAIDGRVLVQDAVDAHVGRRVAGHRGKQNTPQGIAQGVTVAAFKRLHHNPGLYRRQALHINDARFQKSSALHVLSFACSVSLPGITSNKVR